MADTVDTIVLPTGNKRIYAARWTNISDGTGESAVVKVDVSTLVGPNDVAPRSADLLEIAWNIQGFTYIKLLWDATTDDEIKLLTGSGYMDYTRLGALRDPRSAGFVGDVLLTTVGAASGSTYDITAIFELRD